MAEPDHTVALQRAAPDRTLIRPALWIHEKTLDEAFGDPSVMSEQRKIYVDERVGRHKPLPRRRHAPKAIDDPSIPRQQIGVCVQIVLVRDLTSATPVLDDVERI